MMKKSHVVIGVLGTVAAHPHPDLTRLLFLTTGALIGSLLPDWDLRLGLRHRTITHWLIWPVLLLFSGQNYPILIGLATGWLLHILADMLTVEGLRPFWPARWRIHGFLHTNSLPEYILMLPITVGLLYLIAK